MKRTDLRFIKASDVLGVINASAVVRAAQEGLSDPIDPDLLELSLCDPDDLGCISRTKSVLYQREKIDGMDERTALNLYAQVICEEILDKLTEPLRGAEMIARAAISADLDNFTKLDPFIYIYSEARGRPSDKVFFEDAAKREAESFLSNVS